LIEIRFGLLLSKNNAATEARVPPVANAANHRSWGNHNRGSRGNDNRRAWDNDNGAIRTAPTELVAMKARPAAASGEGTIKCDE